MMTDPTSPIPSLTNLAPHNLVKSLYKTMATSLDDAMLGPSMLDLMYTSLGRQISDVSGLVGVGGDDLMDMLPQALKSGWANQTTTTATSAGPVTGDGDEIAVSIFTAPICDLFVELFDLKENKNNWLRRQAIVVILQQLLGSTIERKVRDTFRSSLQPDSIEKVLLSFQELLFPDGVRRPPSDPRADSEKHDTKVRASKKVGLLIPDVAANMIGRSNARRGARRVFGALQDQRLNQQLVLCMFDEIFDVLFPPLS
jgi:sorting nexin-25